MSQHDMVIDNGPGAAVRIDFNSALQALMTMSSGPLEPIVKYAGMLWLDTSVPPNGVMKMRDLANANWIFPSLYGDDRVGEVSYFARSTPPTGWLKANGALVSRSTYNRLFLAIGTQFGNGDGVDTFGLPDLRGYFLRGWDDGRGVDPARSFGSVQADLLRDHGHTGSVTINAGGSHNHGGTANSAGSHAHTGATDTEPAHNHVSSLAAYPIAGSSGWALRSVGSDGNIYNAAAGAHAHALTINAAGAHTHTITTDTEAAHTHTGSIVVNPTTGGAETRPANMSMLACIRYA